MNTFHQTDTFSDWLKNLLSCGSGRRNMAIWVIAFQLEKEFQKCACTLALGIAYTSGNKTAMRIGCWPGGDKSSQQRDIEQAKALRREIKEINE